MSSNKREKSDDFMFSGFLHDSNITDLGTNWKNLNPVCIKSFACSNTVSGVFCCFRFYDAPQNGKENTSMRI